MPLLFFSLFFLKLASDDRERKVTPHCLFSSNGAFCYLPEASLFAFKSAGYAFLASKYQQCGHEKESRAKRTVRE
jgi:hypothetical protein